MQEFESVVVPTRAYACSITRKVRTLTHGNESGTNQSGVNESGTSIFVSSKQPGQPYFVSFVFNHLQESLPSLAFSCCVI
jgi:hypothetical protein